MLIQRNILDFLIVDTIHESLFTSGTIHAGTVHGGTIHAGTVHGGTIHENCFWVFGFVARVRVRADNVFKGKVNNKTNSRESDLLY